MNLYLDTSAIVKRLTAEVGSLEMEDATAAANLIGTTMLSHAEVAAALKKGCRTNALDERSAALALGQFNKYWLGFVRIRVTRRLVKHAATLAWDHDLRGYDAMHLASAAAWQQSLQHGVTIATFDVAQWKAAKAIGLDVYPPDLPAWIKQRPG